MVEVHTVYVALMLHIAHGATIYMNLYLYWYVSLLQDELHPQQVIVENAVQRTQSRIARRSLKR